MGWSPLSFTPRAVLGLALLFVALTACEEPADLGFVPESPKLVASANFFPGETVRVRITATQPITGELNALDITDARVLVMEGNEIIERLTYTPGTDGARGYYVSRLFKPVVGRSYTLVASKNGYVPFQDDTSIPQSVAISDLRIENIDKQRVGNLEIYDFSLLLNYDDPEFEENYYDLRISQIVTPYYTNAAGDTTKLEPRAKTLQPPGQSYAANTVRGEASIIVRDRPAADGLRVQLQSRLDPSREIMGHLQAELRTVSESYFNFKLQYQREGQALPVGFGDLAVNHQSNVPNSQLGIFAGYNRVIRTFSLHN